MERIEKYTHIKKYLTKKQKHTAYFPKSSSFLICLRMSVRDEVGITPNNWSRFVEQTQWTSNTYSWGIDLYRSHPGYYLPKGRYSTGNVCIKTFFSSTNVHLKDGLFKGSGKTACNSPAGRLMINRNSDGGLMDNKERQKGNADTDSRADVWKWWNLSW